jgi:hypothetical protein
VAMLKLQKGRKAITLEMEEEEDWNIAWNLCTRPLLQHQSAVEAKK